MPGGLRHGNRACFIRLEDVVVIEVRRVGEARPQDRTRWYDAERLGQLIGCGGGHSISAVLAVTFALVFSADPFEAAPALPQRHLVDGVPSPACCRSPRHIVAFAPWHASLIASVGVKKIKS